MSVLLRKKSFLLLLPALCITVAFLPHLFDLGLANPPADTDGDGLSDAWELEYFGDLTSQDGSGDPDGDGYYNEEEESLGIDPNVAGGVPGYLSYDAWTGISGNQVDDLVGHVNFHQSPNVSELVLGGQISLSQNNYGGRLRGTITAPVTGSYTFWVAGDNGVQLWLSTDSRKYNRQRIAWHNSLTSPNQWGKYTTQKSAPVQLVAGQKYYIEALSKQSSGADHLSMAWSYEANDLKNWTREVGVTASQSSISYGGAAERAIDGNRSDNWADGSITHTADLDNSWWEVDLGAGRNVERIVLFNRVGGNQTSKRLSNFRVSILDASGNEIVGQNYHTQSGYVDGSLVWDLEASVVAHKVKIEILGRNFAPTGTGVLSLAEVEVLGSASGAASATPLGYLTNWAGEAGVVASQSTTTYGGVAQRAIDGNRDGHYAQGSVSHTDSSSLGNWWQVDLGVQRPVSRIAIYNRTDTAMNRLSNFRIALLDDVGAVVLTQDFYPVEGHVGYRLNWDVPAGTNARTVKIERLGPARDGQQVLSFAEVEVLGSHDLIPGAIVAREAIPTGVLESYVIDPDDPDDDGLPSAWEILHGFDPANAQGSGGGSFGDPDEDLVANWREYQLGTDPNQATSVVGALTEEVWTGIAGRYLADLHTHPKYLQGADYRRLIFMSEGTRWLGDYTGARIRGYLTAPVTGEYRFWLSGNDEVAFWFSGSEDKFAKELLIAPHRFVDFRNYDVELSQQSRVVHLVAGQKYYLEMQHKERVGGGSSPVSLAWQVPGGQRELIAAEHLSTYIRSSNDQDDDDLPDDWELANGLDPNDNGAINASNGYHGDLDGDGLANHLERSFGTRADLADTDGDGINDYDEAQLFETNALAADVAPFQSIQTVSGASFTASEGGWGSANGLAYSTGVRGWIEYEINVPTAGVYLLDFALSPRNGAILSDQYELTLSIDGHFIQRHQVTIAEANTGTVKTLSQWLSAGTHTVRIFNDNALTYRHINVHSLEVLSAQGTDNNSNGTPDWVETRLMHNNGLTSQMTTSRVSPVCIEGRARDTGFVHLSNGGQVVALSGERWMSNLALNPQGAVNLQASFENGGLVENLSISWEPTNLIAETDLTLRQGDSLLLTGHNGPVPSALENVTLTVEGQTHNFGATSPITYLFNNPGSHTLAISVDDGQQIITHNVTVHVTAPLQIESPICVPTHVREWDIPSLPADCILEMDSGIEIRDTIDLGNATTRYLINSDAPETHYANIRLGQDGPILQSIPIRGMTLRDAQDTSTEFVQDFADGSYQVDMPVVVTNLYPDVRINYFIFIGGVTFDTGGVQKDYFPNDFDALGQAMVSFIKTSSSGSNCHRTSIWQGDKRIAQFQ